MATKTSLAFSFKLSIQSPAAKEDLGLKVAGSKLGTRKDSSPQNLRSKSTLVLAIPKLNINLLERCHA